jgi:hypothetical protein
MPDKVAAQLKVDAMTMLEKITYEAHLKNLATSRSIEETARVDGVVEGNRKGSREKENLLPNNSS